MEKKPEDFCMTYKIIGDSCLDLTDELKKDSKIPDDTADIAGWKRAGSG